MSACPASIPRDTEKLLLAPATCGLQLPPFIAGRGLGYVLFKDRALVLMNCMVPLVGLLCAKNSHLSSLRAWSTEEPVRSSNSCEAQLMRRTWPQKAKSPGLFLKGVPDPFYPTPN